MLLRAAAEVAARPSVEAALAAIPDDDVSSALREAAPQPGASASRLASVVDPDVAIARGQTSIAHIAGGDAEIEPLARAAASSATEAAAVLKILVARAEDREHAGHALVIAADAATPKGQAILVDWLPVAGGTAALDYVRRRLESRDEVARTAATRILATWEDFAAAEPLRAILDAPDSTDAQRALAIRGLARLAGMCADAPADRRADAAMYALQEASRPDERKAAIAALGTIPHARAMETLKQLLGGGDLRDEAAFALASLAAVYRDKDRAMARRLAEAVAKSNALEAAKKKAADVVR